ncbi:MAG: hypothetical protein ABIA04_12115 [Pseudomonadota bacterium]
MLITKQTKFKNTILTFAVGAFFISNLFFSLMADTHCDPIKLERAPAYKREADKRDINKIIAESSGLHAAFRDGGELEEVFSSYGLNSDLLGGIGGLIGAKGIQFGSGGLGSRGSGLGGGASASGFGGLGTKGRGCGASGYADNCAGPRPGYSGSKPASQPIKIIDNLGMGDAEIPALFMLADEFFQRRAENGPTQFDSAILLYDIAKNNIDPLKLFAEEELVLAGIDDFNEISNLHAYLGLIESAIDDPIFQNNLLNAFEELWLKEK